jgi:hypothetical protein
MNPTVFFSFLAQLALTGAILLLGHYGFGLLAALLALVPPSWQWYKGGRSRRALLAVVPTAIIGLGVVAGISLSRQPYGQPVFPVITQIALAVAYGAWLLVGQYRLLTINRVLLVSGLLQAVITGAVFLAAAFWRWPDIVVLTLVWAGSFINALWFLTAHQERAAQVLAATWALIVTEVCWVLLTWQVNYIIPPEKGYIIVPQAAIISSGLGYCLASVYSAHAGRRLSRRRLIEYVAIAGVLLAIVIAGTISV